VPGRRLYSADRPCAGYLVQLQQRGSGGLRQAVAGRGDACFLRVRDEKERILRVAPGHAETSRDRTARQHAAHRASRLSPLQGDEEVQDAYGIRLGIRHYDHVQRRTHSAVHDH